MTSWGPMPVIGSATVVRGDARTLSLADNSVDLVVTSPPYWALRSYKDNGEHYAGQIGAEATPAAYIDSLIECTREWMRVLKPSGSIFVNLGDKYAGGGQGGNVGGNLGGGEYLKRTTATARKAPPGIPVKSLIGLPWRYAISCIDDLGLILRAELIWSKPNGLPEPVTDRVRRSHEQWFHLTKSPRYYAAVDAIREAHSDSKSAEAMRQWRQQVADRWTSPDRAMEGQLKGGGRTSTNFTDAPRDPNPLGKLPGSVWEIATQPLKVPAELDVDHYAAFPMEFPRRIILGWSPSGICTACGEGRRPVGTSRITADRGGRQFNPTSGNIGILGKEREYRITGEACACPDTSAPTRPAVVLDPFGGTGTTALVAKMHGRDGISVDASADYCRIAEWRTNDPKQMERATRGPKTKPAPRKAIAGRKPKVIDARVVSAYEEPALFDIPGEGCA